MKFHHLTPLFLFIVSVVPVQTQAFDPAPSVPMIQESASCLREIDLLKQQLQLAKKQQEIWSAIAAEPLAWKRDIARVSMQHYPDLDQSPLTARPFVYNEPGTWAVISRSRSSAGYTLVTFGERAMGGRIYPRGFYVLGLSGKLTSYSHIVHGSWEHTLLKKAFWKSGDMVEYQYRINSIESQDLELRTMRVK